KLFFPPAAPARDAGEPGDAPAGGTAGEAPPDAAAPAVATLLRGPEVGQGSGSRKTVVFDFDHTLYDGDSGSHLFAWLIRRSWWRTLLALLAAPVLGPLIAFLPTRRVGISGFIWIGTVGMPRGRMLDDAIGRYVALQAGQIRARLLPGALDVLRRPLEAGDRVVIATGAPPELARAILGFVAHEHVPVIGTAVGRHLGAIIAIRHCHA